MSLALALCCLSIVAVSVLGGLLPLSRTLTHTRLQLYLSFAAGTMLGAAFFHMLPEAVEIGAPRTLRWTAVGLVTLFLLERFFSFHHHERLDRPRVVERGPDCDHSHGSGPEATVRGPTLNWAAAAIGLSVHSLIGGVALAGAMLADQRTGAGPGAAAWGVFLATLIHKPADSLTVVSLMLRARVRPGHAHLVNLGFAMMIPLGVALLLLGIEVIDAPRSGPFTASVLAFSAGTFLCIALSDLLPELQFHRHDRIKLSAALLLGFGLMIGASLGESGHDPSDDSTETKLDP